MKMERRMGFSEILFAVLALIVNRVARNIKKMKKKRGYRIMVLRRMALVAVSVVLIIVSGVILLPGKASANESTDDVLYKYYCAVEIEEGDTLWSYAQQYSPDENYKTYIQEVCSINHLTSDLLIEGQTLIIPYYSNEYVMK